MRREDATAWVASELLPSEWAEERCWVVVASHTCDIATFDLDAEPFVEVMRAEQIDPPADGNLRYAKNPRRLHLDLDNTEEQTILAFGIHDKTRLPRDKFYEATPDDQRELSNRESELLARWLSRRYWGRDALPDAFNNRLRPVSRKLRSTLKGRGGGLLAGIYLFLHTEEELEDEEPYRIALRGAMEVEDFDDDELRESAESALDDVVMHLGKVDGLAVERWELVSLAEMSLDDLNYYRRWDYDDLSLRSEDAPMAPEP